MRLSALSLSIVILLSGVMVSCKKENSGDTDLKQLDIKKVAYGNDTAQILDVYLPTGRDTGTTKVILYIHGGSWSSGDKSDFDEAIAALRTRLSDFAMFNMNYRLAFNGVNQFPAQLDDIQSALAFINGKANDYHINTSMICLVGASAGAHLALLQAYKNNSNGKIKAVVDLFGPADLTDLYNNHPFPQEARPVLQNFLGTTPSINPVLYQQASPINYVTASSVPTKIFHGDQDIVVPISQSYALKTQLEAAGAKVDMTVYAGEGHGWLGTNLSDTYDKSVSFIKENVR